MIAKKGGVLIQQRTLGLASPANSTIAQFRNKKRQGQSNALPFLYSLELLFCLIQGFFQFG
jgi:hypothetical protein